jgi:hypothetical protein
MIAPRGSLSNLVECAEVVDHRVQLARARACLILSAFAGMALSLVGSGSRSLCLGLKPGPCLGRVEAFRTLMNGRLLVELRALANCIHQDFNLSGWIDGRPLLPFFRFEPMDGRPEPGGQRVLNFQLRSSAVQGLKRFPARRQRNTNARSLCLARAVGNELHQQTFAAGFSVLVLVIS